MAQNNGTIPAIHNEPILELFDYVSNVDFLDIITETSKAFLINDKAKNRKEDIIGFWLVINLRVLIAKYFPNHKNRINVEFMPRITGLLNTTTHEIAISLDGKIILVISIKFIISNLGQNFQRNFDDVVVNTVDINNHKGMDYVNIMILSSETPTFTFGNDKKFEKYEQLGIKHLIKLTNLSLVSKNKTYLPTLILNRNVEISNNGLKSSIKQMKAKYVDGKYVDNLCIKSGFNELVSTRVQSTIIEKDIYVVLNKILYIFKGRLQGSQGND